MAENVICPICKLEAEASRLVLMVLGFAAKPMVNWSQIAHWQCTKTQKLLDGRPLLKERKGQGEGYSGDLATDYHVRF
jgi:hypothetical protein